MKWIALLLVCACTRQVKKEDDVRVEAVASGVATATQNEEARTQTKVTTEPKTVVDDVKVVIEPTPFVPATATTKAIPPKPGKVIEHHRVTTDGKVTAETVTVTDTAAAEKIETHEEVKLQEHTTETVKTSVDWKLYLWAGGIVIILVLAVFIYFKIVRI